MQRIDLYLARRIEHLKVIRVATSRRDMSIKAAKAKYAEEVGTHEAELEATERELGALLRRFHYMITRRYSKTIERPNGTVSEFLYGPEPDWPASEEGLIRTLRASEEGMQFVKVSYSIDKIALKTAIAEGRVSPGLVTRIRRRGFWFGRHRTFFVQSELDDKRKTIERVRFVEPKPMLEIEAASTK